MKKKVDWKIFESNTNNKNKQKFQKSLNFEVMSFRWCVVRAHVLVSFHLCMFVNNVFDQALNVV